VKKTHRSTTLVEDWWNTASRNNKKCVKVDNCSSPSFAAIFNAVVHFRRNSNVCAYIILPFHRRRQRLMPIQLRKVRNGLMTPFYYAFFDPSCGRIQYSASIGTCIIHLDYYFHCRRRRLVEHSAMNYGGLTPACSGLSYGGPTQQQHQLIVRGTHHRGGHGQYTTAAAAATHDYLMPPRPSVVRREVPDQEPQFQAADDQDGAADWVDSCFRVLTCGGLCSWSAVPTVGGKQPHPPRCSMHTYRCPFSRRQTGSQTTGPAVQHADIPPPWQSAANGAVRH